MIPGVNTSTLYTLLILGVPFVAALTAYAALRNRDRSALAAGCSAIVVGVLVSAAITTVYILLEIT